MSSVVLALNPLDARQLVTSFGLGGILLVMFAETGLLVGFFLPGDSLLFTAGLLSAGAPDQLRPPLGWVLMMAATGALVGAEVGYLLGRRAGVTLRSERRSVRIRAGMDRAQELLARYGPGRAIVLARFIPVVRTVFNPLVGALALSHRTFTAWQIAGGLLWTVGLVLAGYLLGTSVPGIDQYLLPVVGLIVLSSLLPLLVALLRDRQLRGRS